MKVRYQDLFKTVIFLNKEGEEMFGVISSYAFRDTVDIKDPKTGDMYYSVNLDSIVRFEDGKE